MPVSHAHRCIFVHVPKTAGISAMRAFADAGLSFELAGNGLLDLIADREDAAVLMARWRAAFPIGSFAGFPQQHLPASVLHALLGPEVWRSYFTFAVVRNPWDMLVSTYFFQRKRLELVAPEARDDLAHAVERAGSFGAFVRLYPALRSDMSTLLDVPDGSEMDFIARFEHLDRDLAAAGERLGLAIRLPHENRSEHGAYREYYDGAARDAVARHFARDIERFGYAF